MAFSVGDRVRVADQSSGYRTLKGTVKTVNDTLYQVRLDGHACAGRVPLLLGQLQPDTTTSPLSYSQCVD